MVAVALVASLEMFFEITFSTLIGNLRVIALDSLDPSYPGNHSIHPQTLESLEVQIRGN